VDLLQKRPFPHLTNPGKTPLPFSIKLRNRGMDLVSAT